MKSSILCFYFLVLSLGVMSQNIQEPINTASIDKEYVISLNKSDNSSMSNDKIFKNYTLDISDLYFKSPENLNQFCKLFSFDIFTLIGDFESKQIIIEFNEEVIESKNMTRLDINNFFSDIAPRMYYINNKS